MKSSEDKLLLIFVLAIGVAASLMPILSERWFAYFSLLALLALPCALIFSLGRRYWLSGKLSAAATQDPFWSEESRRQSVLQVWQVLVGLWQGKKESRDLEPFCTADGWLLFEGWYLRLREKQGVFKVVKLGGTPAIRYVRMHDSEDDRRDRFSVRLACDVWVYAISPRSGETFWQVGGPDEQDRGLRDGLGFDFVREGDAWKLVRLHGMP